MSIAVALLMGIGLSGALLAVGLQNILHAVFGLAISLLAFAGLFLALQSPFVAAMEVLIYVGGISVAMVFAVMLSHALSAPQPKASAGRKIAAAFGATVFFVVMGWMFRSADLTPVPEAPNEAWGLEPIGMALLTHFNLVFETLSVVLLLAIMGAVAIAQRPPRRAEEDRA
jgi:NADH-quinone oxidoreductase subunit J